MNKQQSVPNSDATHTDTLSNRAGADVFELPIDAGLPDDEKRALLASWASDANAVPHLPTLRQLPDGSIVRVADILRSLTGLDARTGELPAQRNSFKVCQKKPGRWWFSPNDRNDDDDDPPPCPAYAAVPPKSGGGAAFEVPEPIAA